MHQPPQHPAVLGALFGALFCLSAVGMPFWSDDWIHLLLAGDALGVREPVGMLASAKPDPLGLFNAFAFFGSGEDALRQAVANGELPWWTSPQIRLSFWRPLSSYLLLNDFKLFGSNPLGAHLHSMLWYVGLCAAVGALYRRALGGLAALAAALYALDDAHWLPMAWIANRNALVAALPALAGLLAHLRWREDGWAPGRALGPLLLAVGFTGGEVALCLIPFFCAYELLGARGSARERWLSILPILFVFLGWALAYRAGGYGGGGSSLYLDPTRQPAEFLRAAPGRALVLVGSALGGLPAELSVAEPELAPFAALYGLFCALVAGACVLGLRGALEPEERRGLRWLVPAAALSLVPVLATFPLDRLLLIPGIASSALVALVLQAGWRARRTARGWLAAGPAVVHLMFPQAFCLFLRQTFGNEDALMPALYADAFPAPEAAPEQRTVVLCASDMSIGLYLPPWAVATDQPLPRSFELISAAPLDHRVRRDAADSYEIELLQGGLHRGFLAKLTADTERPFQAGDRVTIAAGEVEVLRTGGDGPELLRFRPNPDEPPPRLLAWQDGALREVRLEVGEALTIGWTPGPRMM